LKTPRAFVTRRRAGFSRATRSTSSRRASRGRRRYRRTKDSAVRRSPEKGAGFATAMPFSFTPERREISISFTRTSAPTVAFA
jgi:hypothetical protein